MKKAMKRMLLVLMVAVMVTGLRVSAITIETSNQTGTVDGNSKLVTNKAELIVTNIENNETFGAYKVLDIFYNTTTNTMTYEFTSNFKQFLSQNETYESLTVENYLKEIGSSIEEENSSKRTGSLDKLASAYAAYVKTHSITENATLTGNGGSSKVSVETGAYLILPKVTTRVFGVMVGNVSPARGADGEWVINGTSIVAKATSPSVTKTVGDDRSKEKSYSYGDTIPYYITINVPSYPTDSKNKTFKLTDTMSEYLNFSLDSIVIQDDDASLSISKTNENSATATNTSTKQVVATITLENNKIVIEFNVDNINSGKINISYDATLSNEAPLGANNPVTNNAVLEYSNDPYNSSGTTSTSPEETTVKTYGIYLEKYDAKDAGIVKDNLLDGAVFQLCSDKDCSTSHIIQTLTTKNGVIEFKGIEEGTYYLKETKAPSGYSLVKEPITVTVNESAGEYNDDTGMVKVSVPNTLVGNLPVTGGMGTILFTVSGAVLMIGAIWFIFVYKKNKKNQEA